MGEEDPEPAELVPPPGAAAGPPSVPPISSKQAMALGGVSVLVLERLLGPLGFVRAGEAMHRWSDDRRVVQVVAPFFYSLGSARGKQTVEIGFLCPDIARHAVPDLTVPALPEVSHCRSAWGFDFRLENLLGEKVAAGWPAEDAVRNVLAHLRDVVERLG